MLDVCISSSDEKEDNQVVEVSKQNFQLDSYSFCGGLLDIIWGSYL
jgi:hypothetical protein